MAARKRLLLPLEEVSASSTYEAPKRKAPEFDTCNFLIEAVSPQFDPNRVLLQRVFFINEEKNQIRIYWILSGPKLSALGLIWRIQKNRSYSRSSTWQQWLTVNQEYVNPSVITNNTGAQTALLD
jgi:hypothetical protein